MSEICTCPTCGVPHVAIEGMKKAEVKAARIPQALTYVRNPALCIYEVKGGEDEKGNWIMRQCTKKRDLNSKNGTYCLQHGKLYN